RGDAENRPELSDALDGGVVDEANRVPEKAALVGHDELGAVPDADTRIGRHDEAAGLVFVPGEALAVALQLFEGGPPLAGRGDPLTIVVADRADLRERVGVLDAARGA